MQVASALEDCSILFHQVAIVWRVKDRELKYTWYENGWCGPKDVDRLTETLNDLQDGEIELEMSAVVPDLHNEHAKVRNIHSITSKNIFASSRL